MTRHKFRYNVLLFRCASTVNLPPMPKRKIRRERAWKGPSNEWLKAQVGANEIQWVSQVLHNWLFGQQAPPGELRYRLAPSLIARSECELFAVSAPRFAVRVRFKDGSFANLRRIKFLLETVENWGEPPDVVNPAFTYDLLSANQRSPLDLLRGSQRCLADSLICFTDSETFPGES